MNISIKNPDVCATLRQARHAPRGAKMGKNADFCSAVFSPRVERSEQTSHFFELGDIPRTYYPLIC
jgi:hypothetical protein